MRLHRGPLPDADPATELAVAHALVRRVGRGELDGGTVRVYSPREPVVVLGRRDTRSPGLPQVVAAAERVGFTPLVRVTGGRAVAYTAAAVVVDEVHREPNSAAGMDARFRIFGERFVEVLEGLGVEARVGAVPGEYCPGAFSVNARGSVKLVGTAQRVVKNAWLFSSLLVVGDEERIGPVLADVYSALDQPFDVASVGSVAGERPGLTVEDVQSAILAAWAGAERLEPADLDDATVDLAHELAAQHRVPSQDGA